MREASSYQIEKKITEQIGSNVQSLKEVSLNENEHQWLTFLLLMASFHQDFMTIEEETVEGQMDSAEKTFDLYTLISSIQ